jgi:intraflagellar transport protein 122
MRIIWQCALGIKNTFFTSEFSSHTLRSVPFFLIFSFYRMTPKQALVLVEKQLSYYPLCMHSVNNSITKTSYLVLAGSNKQIQILSREGVKLAVVTKPADSWLWAVDTYVEDDTMIIGSHFGKVEYIKMDFNSVHSLYRDRYAYRENLTEVIVHHLQTDKKVRIKCKDMIHNLSLYRNKLAVQLLDRICVYESSSDDIDIHFRLRKERIIVTALSQNADTKLVHNLMVATSSHVLVGYENVLELYSMDGSRVKLWKLETNVQFMRVDGGLDNSEGILIGLVSGVVYRLYIDNPFMIEIVKKPKSVVKIDINIYKTLLLTIENDHTLSIIDLSTQETIFTQSNVISACFNNEVEDLLCFTNVNNLISVVSGLVPLSQNRTGGAANKGKKTWAPEIQELHLSGCVLGFRGQKIYCLLKNGFVGIDVPQGANMLKALDNNDFESAYKVGCLGATEVEWRLLAMRSLRANKLTVAKNAFSRLKDTKYLSLIEAIEKGVNITSSGFSHSTTGSSAEKGLSISSTGRNRAEGRGNSSNTSSLLSGNNNANNQQAVSAPLDPRWQAEIMAYEGHYHEAAKIFTRNGKLDDAIQMFVVLRKWEEAKTFARNSGSFDVNVLTAQQAKWLQEIKDWKGAAELFMSMGQYNQAAKIIGDYEGNGWQAVMMEVVRSCSPEDKETLLFCGEKLSHLEDIALAKETFIKAGDYSKLMTLYVNRKMWTEAAKLADEYQGKFDMSVFLSYAEWLVSQDRYEEAMEAFKKCGRIDLSRKVLTELTENAVNEKRFKDAGYYYWMLAKEIEQELTNPSSSAAISQGKTDQKTVSSGSDYKGGSEMKGEESKDGNTANNELVRRQDTLAALQSEYEHKADLYYAYSSIHSYVTDPFTSFQPEMLFQVSRFIINSLGVSDSVPLGVSKTSTLYTLAKQAMFLECYKLARNAFDRLSKLTIPEKRLDEIELDMLLVQAKPVRDTNDHAPVCYRCGSINPLLNPFTNRFAKGDVCTNCGHPFVRSFINFDILPLVEFVPDPSISDDEAIDLIRQPPAKTTRLIEGKGGRWKEETVNEGNVNMLSLNNSMEGDQSMLMGNDAEGADLFGNCLNKTLERQVLRFLFCLFLLYHLF